MTPAVCHLCGHALHRWYRPAADDPDDVEPAAECSNPDCDFSY